MNVKEVNTNIICPRCMGYIPNNEWPGMYPGALSRTDNKTEICSECGNQEAIEDWQGTGPLPQNQWMVQPK